MVSERAVRTVGGRCCVRLRSSAVVLTAVLVVAVGGAVVERDAADRCVEQGLCKGKTSRSATTSSRATQPFANLVTKGLKDAAKKTRLRHVVITTVDNLNGPVAVGNVKTMLNQEVNGFIDFHVLAPFQPAIAKLVKEARRSPASRSSARTSRARPSIGADNYGASVLNGQVPRRPSAKKSFRSTVPVRRRRRRAVGRRDRHAALLRRGRRHQADLQEPAERPRHPGERATGPRRAPTTTPCRRSRGSPATASCSRRRVNDEVAHGHVQGGAGARKLKNYLVNSFGGDPFGLSQVCADRTHYVGALYLAARELGRVGARGRSCADQRDAVPEGSRHHRHARSPRRRPRPAASKG